MSCPKAEVFLAYAAGSFDSLECAALERHFERCAGCRKLAMSQKALWHTLDGLPVPAVSEDFDRCVYDKIAQEGQWHWWHFFRRPQFSGIGVGTAVPVAAGCLTLLAVFVFRGAPTLPPYVSQPVAIEQKVDVEQVERTLDDLDMLKQLTPDSQS